MKPTIDQLEAFLKDERLDVTILSTGEVVVKEKPQIELIQILAARKSMGSHY